MMFFTTAQSWCFFTALLLLTMRVAHADTLFDKPVLAIEKNAALMAVIDHLKQSEVIRSQFVQQKKLKILRKPMRSSGSMIYSKKQGLFWRVDFPFSSTLLITRSVLIQKDGSNIQMITAKSQPVIFGFSQVFFQLLSGNIKALGGHFALYFYGDEKNWRIGLLPKSARLKQFISQIILQGSKQLESVQMIDRSGDSTDINLTATNSQPNSLTAVERGYFEY